MTDPPGTGAPLHRMPDRDEVVRRLRTQPDADWTDLDPVYREVADALGGETVTAQGVVLAMITALHGHFTRARTPAAAQAAVDLAAQNVWTARLIDDPGFVALVVDAWDAARRQD